MTHAHTTTADVHEARCTGKIHKSISDKDLKPSVHLADAAYITAAHLAEAEDSGFQLLGPTRKDPSWQSKVDEAFDRSTFEVDYEKESVTCPTGKTSASWKTCENESRGEHIKVRFSPSDCQACQYRILCTKGENRNLLLHPENQDRALRETRDLMETDEGKLLYQLRAGVEAAISQGLRAMWSEPGTMDVSSLSKAVVRPKNGSVHNNAGEEEEDRLRDGSSRMAIRHITPRRGG